jgi:hypothetical protein
VLTVLLYAAGSISQVGETAEGHTIEAAGCELYEVDVHSHHTDLAASRVIREVEALSGQDHRRLYSKVSGIPGTVLFITPDTQDAVEVLKDRMPEILNNAAAGIRTKP